MMQKMRCWLGRHKWSLDVNTWMFKCKCCGKDYNWAMNKPKKVGK